MAHILEISDQTLLDEDKVLPNAASGELDLVAERASTLDLLSARFGEAKVDWGTPRTLIRSWR